MFNTPCDLADRGGFADPGGRSATQRRRRRNGSFAAWKMAVNAEIGRRAGLSADDLPDCCYRDWYEDGVSPKSAAGRALREAGADL